MLRKDCIIHNSTQVRHPLDNGRAQMRHQLPQKIPIRVIAFRPAKKIRRKATNFANTNEQIKTDEGNVSQLSGGYATKPAGAFALRTVETAWKEMQKRTADSLVSPHGRHLPFTLRLAETRWEEIQKGAAAT